MVNIFNRFWVGMEWSRKGNKEKKEEIGESSRKILVVDRVPACLR